MNAVTLRNPLHRLNLQDAFAPQRRWHTLWLLCSWAYFLFAAIRLWQMLDGRMYYLLDSDMCSEMVLAYQLRQEHALLSPNWFYSTELRVFNLNWFFTPFFFFTDNWHTVRLAGTALTLLCMVAACAYCCVQAGIGHLFAAIAGLLLTPFSEVYFRILLLTISYPPYIILSFLSLGLVFQYQRAASRRTRGILLAILAAVSLLAGLNGLRQVLIYYIPLFLGVATLCYTHVSAQRDRFWPALDGSCRRLLLAGGLSCVAALAGWQINTRVLRYHYHYTSQEGVQFRPFTLERVEQLMVGWLESFGYQSGDYITGFQLVNNALCFLALAVFFCALYSGFRHPERYTLPERLLHLMSFYGFAVYHGLYLFTDMVYYTRYNIPIVILAMPVVVVFLYRLPVCRLYRAMAFAVLTGLMAICLQDYYKTLWPKNMTGEHEKAVHELRVAGYTEGYASFWNGNLMVEMSNGAFDIRVWELAT